MSDLKTTGEFRKFLCETLEKVSAGEITAKDARNISKLAAQVNHSFYSEVNVLKLSRDLGEKTKAVGETSLK